MATTLSSKRRRQSTVESSAPVEQDHDATEQHRTDDEHDDANNDRPSSPAAAPAEAATRAHDEDVEGQAAIEAGDKAEANDTAAVGVHKGQAGWTAVWDPTHSAYYFYNSFTSETTWTNPLEAGGSQPDATASGDGTSDDQPTAPGASQDQYGGIDPDLAFLDPNLKRRADQGVGATVQGRFNARTGRFQADATANPDRVSEYNRGMRQQQAFYNVDSWTDSLQGRGLRLRADDDNNVAEGSKRKKPSSKEVQAFKQRKEAKKRAKLIASMK
ncbi:hypothetical protein ACM66B_005520 [Microbotryomycetes sp. NB124-2]